MAIALATMIPIITPQTTPTATTTMALTPVQTHPDKLVLEYTQAGLWEESVSAFCSFAASFEVVQSDFIAFIDEYLRIMEVNSYYIE